MGFQEVMKALSDPTRREILNMLKSGAMAATQIADRFDTSGAAVSKHLAILREAELVRTRREGKYIYYELTASVLEEVMLWLQGLKEESK
ncbi:MAG: winged helix-turn-helix transcriptional regulator [Oscillospiraceae bacterium]|nr:winged helix-turn-helix transcriptional regulator [Oscillospiraceae bacterium]